MMFTFSGVSVAAINAGGGNAAAQAQHATMEQIADATVFAGLVRTRFNAEISVGIITTAAPPLAM